MQEAITGGKTRVETDGHCPWNLRVNCFIGFPVVYKLTVLELGRVGCLPS